MRLRELLHKDAKYMLEWMHDKNVVCDLKTDFSKKTLSDCEGFIKNAQKSTSNMHLAIANDADEYMGTVSLKNIRKSTAEFGIAVRTCAMGRGYAKYGMQEMLRIGLQKGLFKIYWCVSPDNGRAIRFYDKQGFHRCGIPIEATGYTDEEKNNYVWYEYVKNLR